MPYYRLASNQDECRVWYDGSIWHFDYAHHETIPGYIVSNIHHAGYAMIFRNIPILPLSIISNALIRFTTSGPNDLDYVKTYLKGEKTPNPLPFTDYADYNARSRTTSFIDWPDIGHWETNKEYYSPDIKNIIQEIVNLPTWEAGKSICIFWEDHDGRSTPVDYTTRMADTHHHDPLRAPCLIIDYLDSLLGTEYLFAGDTLQKVDHPTWQGQTFRVLKNHTLEFIDLEMRGVLTMPEPVIQVFYADANHEPFGNCLSRNRYTVEKKSGLFTTGRVRFSMQPVLLDTLSYYVIIVSNFPPLGGSSAYWQYDKGDATYPRGIRISTPDGGITWTKHYNDDHIFAVFGTPPAPEPPPQPPITNWTILDVEQIITLDGYKIVVTTNSPCHLYMLWTIYQPLKHTEAMLRRGVFWKNALRFCFVDYHENEQEELGDTIYHTFIKEPWAICETRWFTFRAKVDGEWSPSIGPIFKKHKAFGVMVFHPDAHPETSSVDGYAGHAVRWATWTNLVDAAGTFAFDALVSLVHQFVSWANPGEWERMMRPILVFDTTPLGAIPGLTVVSATLKIWLDHKDDVLNAKPDYALYGATPNSDTALIPADYAAVGNIIMSSLVPWDDWVDHESSTFTLNQAGVDNINLYTPTRFSIRDAKYEVPHLEPPFAPKVPTSIHLHSADYGGHAIPTLTVVYKVPPT